ncbi:MAG: N-acetyltransferase [Christensenellaceae bacterium]|jgi:GNAT superfamily N-acetyltransferase|nr:N-acetyltransferase [Christensenellaceae bacterium]
MLEIREVKNRLDLNRFISFPIKLYKGVEYFVPDLAVDEIHKFGKKENEFSDSCKHKCFIAFRDGKIVGRIAGIIQQAHNQKSGAKRVRFSRFDSIDDREVAHSLFWAVEAWAKTEGMEEIHGPLGFNDLDREGMLIKGFDQLCTFEEQYNYDYYPKLVESYGFKKETDWLEYRLFKPKERNLRMKMLAEAVIKRYKLRALTPTNLNKFVKQYSDGFFECINRAYAPLHGVVPIEGKVKKAIINQFKMVLNPNFIIILVDENEKIVAIGFALPNMSDSVNKSKGKLFPFGIFRILKDIKHPKKADLGLIAVVPEYQNKGLNAVMMNFLFETMIKFNLEYCETNLNLEDNSKVQAQWGEFEYIQHKRRRCYTKKIT